MTTKATAIVKTATPAKSSPTKEAAPKTRLYSAPTTEPSPMVKVKRKPRKSKSDEPAEVKEKRTKAGSYPQYREEIGPRIKAVRNNMGLIQDDFARLLSSEEVKVSKEAVRALEFGTMGLNIFILRRLKQVTKRSYEYFLDGYAH